MNAAWRLLLETEPGDGAANMARDRAIQLAHAQGLVAPTLRLYRWARPTVSIGRFQQASSVDLSSCAQGEVDLVRRFTGGRGVLHDDEVTYSLVTGVDQGLPRSVAASYRILCGMLVEAYAMLGVPAQLTARPRGDSASAACYLHATHADVSVGTAKLSGSAQVWHEGTVLQHGSVVRSRDVEREACLFGLDADGAEALKAGTATLMGLLGAAPSNESICAALVRGLEQSMCVVVEPGELTDLEMDLERDLTPTAHIDI